jgi:hypothetical protein
MWGRDATDARVGKRAAHKSDVLHPGEAKIRDELPATAHQAIVFLADEARSDALPCRHKLLQADRANAHKIFGSRAPGHAPLR